MNVGHCRGVVAGWACAAGQQRCWHRCPPPFRWHTSGAQLLPLPTRSSCLPSPLGQAKLNLVDPGLFPLHEGPPAEEAPAELPPNCVVRPSPRRRSAARLQHKPGLRVGLRRPLGLLLLPVAAAVALVPPPHPSPPTASVQVGASMLRYHLRPLAKKGVDMGEGCLGEGGHPVAVR